jgi:hypothetical protein
MRDALIGAWTLELSGARDARKPVALCWQPRRRAGFADQVETAR